MSSAAQASGQDLAALTPVEDLIAQIRAYNPRCKSALLRRAYEFGRDAHKEHRRATGEPYFIHPIAVAQVLINRRLDDASIATAFLHDTVEDAAPVTINVIAREFGEEIAKLVDGVTKLEKLEDKRKAHDAQSAAGGLSEARKTEQAENFRKLFIAVSRDPRVLLVKLADRLHNMQTLRALPRHKQERIARETLELYAPLAGRLGMQQIREEIEDLSFRVLYPGARFSILKRLAKLRREHGAIIIEKAAQSVRETMMRANISAEVQGRQKRPYAIWRKMQEKRLNSLSKLSDVVGFRVITPTVEDCYRALGAAHTRWEVIPTRFKDYISAPKKNGYRSLHTTVIGEGKRQIEIQIRTREMHEVAEAGVAAHWSYKDGVRLNNQYSVNPYSWLRALMERIEKGESAQEFMETAKAEMHLDQIFCLTPDSEVIGLPHGATPLDFAYAVHTDVGDSCIGAEIDGARAPLSTTLQNGQTVRILRSEAHRPTIDMIDWAKTARAKTALRRAARLWEREDHARQGRHLAQKFYRQAGADLNAKAGEAAAAALGFSSAVELFAAIWRESLAPDGQERKSLLAEMLGATHPDLAAKAAPVDAMMRAERPSMPVKELAEGAVYRYCRLCQPLPGDRIIGLRDGARQRIVIHVIDCEKVAQDEENAESWVDATWSEGEEAHPDHQTRITTIVANRPSALGTVCALIGSMGANIEDIHVKDKFPDFRRVDIEMTLRDVKHLIGILRALEAQDVVYSAERMRGVEEQSAPTR